MDSPHVHGRETPLIQVEGLDKSFRNSGAEIKILKNVDFEMAAGETAAVVGPSGIGKSTLLHILGTLDRPDRGKILFNGQDVFALDHIRLAAFRNESIGFVFQFHHLLPEFSAIENAMMPAYIQGIIRLKAHRMAEEILVRVGLKDRLHHAVTKLSGGEQQRVALARALVLNPLVLLADEPTGNLDRKNAEQVHELLMALNQEYGMTLVVITHNMALASYMSRRVTISEGRLVDTD
ncbi:MAG: ABC transporter ATP-binding protein [Thermodesulfobacteriota bacterium]|nr:ABC transporter ATP-binding protein [Thermodesulfobacteriota bacterium]